MEMIKSIRCFSYPSIGLKSSNTLKFISAFVWALSFFSFLFFWGVGEGNLIHRVFRFLCLVFSLLRWSALASRLMYRPEFQDESSVKPLCWYEMWKIVLCMYSPTGLYFTPRGFFQVLQFHQKLTIRPHLNKLDLHGLNARAFFASLHKLEASIK